MGIFLALFYLLTALVWLSRARKSLRLLQENPQILPAALNASETPWVSILLPVKNEEKNLAACLEALVGQTHPFKEIIVINDHSMDRTGEILADWVRLYPNQVRSLNAPDLPPGWTGKNWALAQGVPFARGEWLLFTDADTRHDPPCLSSALAHAESRDLDVLTLSPRCLAEGFWEKTVQPAAMGFMGLWFPFAEVNRPRSPVIFGNGQYLLIRKKVYAALGGHEKVKGAFLEDFALVREAKRSSFRAQVAIGTKVYGTRMYGSFSAIWCGWRRIFLHAFEKNPVRLFQKAVSVFTFSFLPFLFFPFLTQLALTDPESLGKFWGASFPVLALIFMTALKTHSVVEAPRFHALFHPLAGCVLAGVLWDAAWIALQKKEVVWR